MIIFFAANLTPAIGDIAALLKKDFEGSSFVSSETCVIKKIAANTIAKKVPCLMFVKNVCIKIASKIMNCVVIK